MLVIRSNPINRPTIPTPSPVNPGQPPAAPSNLSAIAVSVSQVLLALADNSNNEDGFKYERKVYADGAWGPYQQIALVGPNVTVYLDAGLFPDTQYSYRARSFIEANGNSAYSNEATATTDALPDAITLREIATTGSINADSNQLVIASNVGFLEGDHVIVAVGQEPGGGLRGTKGVAGTWPALSYANAAAMNADTSQPANTYAWKEDTGDVYQFHRIVANAWASVIGYNGTYYFVKAIPKALQATVTDVSGNGLTLTLDANAVVSVIGANVYLDNAPILNALTASSPDYTSPSNAEALAAYTVSTGATPATPSIPVSVVLPSGNFAVGGVWQVGFRRNWTIAGQGEANTKFFSPAGVPSLRLDVSYSGGTVLKDFEWKGNAGDNQFGLSWYTPGHVFASNLTPEYVTETLTPQGTQYPKGIEFYASHNSVVQDVKVIDAFQRAVGASFCNNVWAYRVVYEQTVPGREYTQAQMLFTDCTGGGFVDCDVHPTSNFCILGYEAAWSGGGVSFIRCTGLNTTNAFNSTGGYLMEDCRFTFNANCRHPEFPISTPIININANQLNLQGGNPGFVALMEQGGVIRNVEIIQEGYIDAQNNTFKGIVGSSGNPNIRIEGGVYIAPDYVIGSATQGPLGLELEGENSVADGYKVFGRPMGAIQPGNGYPSIYVHFGTNGTAQNCVGEIIWADNLASNQTPAQYGPPPTFVPSTPTPSPDDPPTPIPPGLESPSPNGTRGIRVVDIDGAVWTIQDLGGEGKTIRHGVWMGGGMWVSTYGIEEGAVLAYSDPLWWRWNGTGWVAIGNSPPGPDPGPVPVSASYYVSPSGNDSNAGTEAAPFLTIQKARDVVRTIDMGGDILVYLRGGTYALLSTVVFTEADSGRNGFKVTYRCYPWERPVFTGGVPITGWTNIGGGIWSAPAGGKLFRQLYVNGVRGWIARSTAVGTYNTVQDWVGPQWDGTANETRQIKVAEGEVGTWANLSQVEMVIHMEWNQVNLKIASIDVSGGSAYITPVHPNQSHVSNAVLRKANWNKYFFQNAYEFLNTPGEFYLNRATDTVYYMPREGENMATASVIVPQLERLFQVQGTIDNYVHGLQFIGLTLEASTWDLPSIESFSSRQADIIYSEVPTVFINPYGNSGAIPAAFHVQYARGNRFDRIVFRNLGGSAFSLFKGTEDNIVDGFLIRDVAAGGISVDQFLEETSADSRHQNRSDVVTNNYVTRIGQDYHSSVAIFLGYTHDITVEHNEVDLVPYSAFSVGWFGPGTQLPQLHDNRIRYNRISRAMWQMSDGAAVYTLSMQPGTQILGNWIKNMERSAGAGEYWIGCLYFDLDSRYMTVGDNVLEDLRNDVRTFNFYDGPSPAPTNGTVNTIYNNEGSDAGTKANSGLQAGYLGAGLEAGFE